MIILCEGSCHLYMIIVCFVHPACVYTIILRIWSLFWGFLPFHSEFQINSRIRWIFTFFDKRVHSHAHRTHTHAPPHINTHKHRHRHTHKHTHILMHTHVLGSSLRKTSSSWFLEAYALWPFFRIINMNIYICVHVHIRIYMYIFIYTHIYIYTHTYTSKNEHHYVVYINNTSIFIYIQLA